MKLYLIPSCNFVYKFVPLFIFISLYNCGTVSTISRQQQFRQQPQQHVAIGHHNYVDNQHREKKTTRDMMEIIKDEEIMFPSNVVTRTKLALQTFGEILPELKNVILKSTNSTNNETTSDASPTTLKPLAPAMKVVNITAPLVTDPPRRPEPKSILAGMLGHRMHSLTLNSKLEGKETTMISNATITQLLDALKSVFNASELLMEDKMSPALVFILEENARIVMKVTTLIPPNDTITDYQDVLFWISYSTLSTKHAFSRIMEQEHIHFLLKGTDDITITITAGFCILAAIMSGFMIHRSFSERKPGAAGKYDVGRKDKGGRNEATRNPSSSEYSPNRHNPEYISPSRPGVATRSNPLYSSHRGVDVDENTPTSNNQNYDIPSADRNNPKRKDSVAERNERNLNGGRGNISPQPRTHAPDYKDPRRDRRGAGNGKDNDGYLADEMIGVRSDSESVL